MNKKMLSIVLTMGLCLNLYAQDLVPMHNEKGQFGYGVKGDKTFTIKPQWDEAKPFNEQGVAIVRKGEKFGIINKQGKAIGKKMGYTLIAPYDGTDYWLVAEGGKRTDKMPKNRVSLCTYGFKGSLNYGISGAKWGLINKDGQIIIKPAYQELSDIMAGNVIAFQEKNSFGLISKAGKVLFPATYDVITPFNNQGIAALRNKKGSKWSVVDKDGKVIVPESEKGLGFYNFKDDYIGSLNLVNVDTLLAHKEIWNNPEILLPLMNFNITWINSSHPYVTTVKKSKDKKIDAEFIIYDLEGKQINKLGSGLTNVMVPSDGIAVAYDGKRLGFFDLNSQTFTPANNSRTYLPFKDGYSMSYNSKSNKDFYIVDKKNEKVSEVYDNLQLANDRYIVQHGDSFGIISKQGKSIVPVRCLQVFDANSGLFGVKNAKGKFGYVDKDGKTVVPMSYDNGLAFTGDYAIVTLNKKSGIINKDNKIIVPLKYNKVCSYVDNGGKLSVWVADNGNYSYVEKTSAKRSKKGQKLTPTEYTEMKLSDLGIVVKNSSNMYGLIHDGKEAIPCVIKDEELLSKVYEVMTQHNMTEVTEVEAHRIAAWTNEARNTYKLSDTIDDNIWDF